MCLSFFEKQIDSFEKKLEMYRLKQKDRVGFWDSFTLEEAYMEKMDDVILYTYHFIQGLPKQEQLRDRIIQSGKIFKEDVETIASMKSLNLSQLTWIVEKECKSKLKSSVLRGSLMGVIHPLYGTINLPIEIVLYVQTIQTIGLTFGHEMNNPYEMMLALNILNAAMMPKSYQFEEWTVLKKKLTDRDLLNLAQEKVITGKGPIIQILYQVLSLFCSRVVRRKGRKHTPLLGIGISGITTYYHMKKVIEFSLKFYQYRFICEKRLRKGML
ncbi:EcsC family protein [Salirhabdus sp. Marseille-P4669]|uniref:EcsC family protein n=1 Tax=Salirhabdus sp. Marseille-P4669 TaxID=2042310 RepID=UPI000C7ABDB2|nr:EcsC family protein [Salirhabdus sp. Marseille-P4669]